MYAEHESSLNGWHPGELAMQRKMGFEKAPGLADSWRYIYGELTHQHKTFHTSNLHFLPVVTLDADGRPWSSILAGATGEIGWIKPTERQSVLRLSPRVSKGDPFWENAELLGKGEGEHSLIAGIGVEVSTRRRNKLAGKVQNLQRSEDRTVAFDLEVNEATGNCPKYIVIRAVEPQPNINPTIVHDNPFMAPSDRLPPDVLSFINAADTVWLGTAYLADPSSLDSIRFPSHLGINHRGGHPGWVRVKPSDGRTLVLPDFSGNRWMSSLGNIESTPVASLVIADFKRGDVLYLTGDATNAIGEAAEEIMPMQKALTTLSVTGYRFVRDSLPVRQKPLSESEEVELSPYSPPVKLLKEEIEAQGKGNQYFVGEASTATLQKIEFHSPTIATFTFHPSKPLRIRPGQAIILEFKSLLGSPQYRHMSGGKPSLVNDDFIRTWTVSSYHPTSPTSAPDGGDEREKSPSFRLTMKEKEGGVVTGALFKLATTLEARMPHLLGGMTSLQIQPRIVGVSGEFYLDHELSEGSRRLVWGAGGIGVTPFITMLQALASSTREETWDIILLLSTREPEVLVPLIEEALGSREPAASPTNIRLQLHLFTRREYTPSPTTPLQIEVHQGRLGPGWLRGRKELLQGREAYICGPREFENVLVGSLVSEVGLEKRAVRRETFAY